MKRLLAIAPALSISLLILLAMVACGEPGTIQITSVQTPAPAVIPPPSDCSTGAAVPNPGANPGLGSGLRDAAGRKRRSSGRRVTQLVRRHAHRRMGGRFHRRQPNALDRHKICPIPD